MSRVQMVIKAFDRQTAENAGLYVMHYAKEMRGVRASLVRMPTKVKRFALLKSPFKYHKHFEAFQFQTYKRLITLKNVPLEQEGHIDLIKDQLPAGVNLRVTTTRPLTVPLPKKAAAALPGCAPQPLAPRLSSPPLTRIFAQLIGADDAAHRRLEHPAENLRMACRGAPAFPNPRKPPG